MSKTVGGRAFENVNVKQRLSIKGGKKPSVLVTVCGIIVTSM